MLLDGEVAPAQLVIFGVGNGRRVLGVIAQIILGDRGREARKLGGGLLFGQLLDGFAG
jgi:hypothetical protein